MSAPAFSSRVEPLQALVRYDLDHALPLTLVGASADLYLSQGEGRRGRFLATLPPGTLLPPTDRNSGLYLLPRRDGQLRDDGGGDAAAWVDALARAAGTIGRPDPAQLGSAKALAETTRILRRVIGTRIEADADGAAQEQRRQAIQDEKFQATLRSFGKLLKGSFKRPPAGVQSSLVQTLAHLVALGHGKPVAVREVEGESREDYLGRFAASHGMRLRRLRLEPGAIPRGDGPFLVFGTDGRPLLVRPRIFGGYLVEDMAVEPTVRRLRPGQWAQFAPEAYSFYRTLPQGKLDYRQIIGFGLRENFGDFALVALCGLVGAALAMLPPIASQQISGIAVHTGDTTFLLQLLGLLAIAMVTETVLHAVGQLAELRSHGRSGLALHAAMVDRLLRLPSARLRASTTLILATQTETIEKFRRSVLSVGMGFMLALFSGLMAAVVLASVAPLAGLVAMALVVALISLAALIGWAQFKAIYEGERMDVIVLAFAYDLVRLVPVLRAGQLERQAFTQWGDNFLAFQSRMMRATRLTNLFAIIRPFWDSLALVLCFAVIAFMGATSHLDAGLAIVFVLSLQRFTAAGKELAQLTIGAAKLLPMAKLARSLIDYETEPLPNAPVLRDLAGGVTLKDVSFAYGSRQILGDIDLEIAPGEFVGLAGPSGSGKSTLLHVLAGLERPASGRILIDGYDISGLERRQYSSRIGMVMQHSKLFPGSLFDNIRGVSGIGEQEAWHFAREAGIADEIEALPMGLQTIVGDEGAGFAFGQIQRILIARALAKRPAILLLDETLSALDGSVQDTILNALRRQGMTRILVAHRPSSLLKAERIVVIDEGVLRDDGPSAAVIERHAFLNAQIGRPK
ncbi:MAG: ATP-binding cassette domain-containing protein [Devosia sp.]|nr:ATP-binding cassette domain-containing protein [Devosia sp.]